MTDDWDDGSDDEWDVDDDALDQKLGLKKDEPANNFDDEEDLALAEKAAKDKAAQQENKKRGNALAAKKAAEEEKALEAYAARKALEEEEKMMANLSVEDRRALERQRQEQGDMDMLEDAFGSGGQDGGVGSKVAQQAGDKVVLKDMKDHLKHARKVATAMKERGNIAFATLFIKEVIEQSKDVLDDAAIQDIIKTCNVLKNEKVQAAKRKVKGQAQKSKKQDKIEKAKAKKVQDEIFGDSNQYDAYDEIGEQYEDDFF